ncbi:MAG: hypothetical protein E6I87_08685 [Chloroflexi bacterium]|nr:MAG: hypothetical protein E6I87_08685 [Chloroflexota bacterium]
MIELKDDNVFLAAVNTRMIKKEVDDSFMIFLTSCRDVPQQSCFLHVPVLLVVLGSVCREARATP